MSIDEKVVVRSRPEAISTQPTVGLLDGLLAPESGGHQAPLGSGPESVDESQVERTLRSAIYGLPGR